MMKPVHIRAGLERLRYSDSNADWGNQNPMCYHYTIPQFRVQRYQLFSNCLEIIAHEGGAVVGEDA